jgi:hypothetical protein
MILKDAQTYRAPDGRRFIAKSESRQYDPTGAWTLVPPELYQVAESSWRISISQLLFVENEGIYAIDLSSRPLVRDTGWTLADLVPE